MALDDQAEIALASNLIISGILFVDKVDHHFPPNVATSVN